MSEHPILLPLGTHDYRDVQLTAIIAIFDPIFSAVWDALESIGVWNSFCDLLIKQIKWVKI